ncbi:WD40 repeat domain-containing protein [Actinomadura scrupuli]|uniref:WD40 repeat domain-containing protein n=1 Tax=Actinomadura scrupuli TaxID=559629 RepID=UPI003D96133A
MGRPGLLTAMLAGMVCCGIALPVAQGWTGTGERLGARVSDCGVWLSDAGVLRCDYQWGMGGERFSSRLRGADWPDGHRTDLWVDPDDPAHADPGKAVVPPLVLLASSALGLLVVTVRLFRWTSGPGGPAADAPSPSRAHPVRGLPRRAAGFTAVLGGLAVAAVPAGALVSEAAHRPVPYAAPPAVLPAPRSPVLLDASQLPADGVHDSCSAVVGGADDRSAIVDTSTATGTSTLRVRETATERDVTLTVPAIVSSAAVAPGGGTVAAGDTGGTVRLLDVASGRVTATLSGSRWVDSVAFSPDGTTVAVAAGVTVRLWDVASLRATATLFARGFGVSLVAFGRDGTTLTVCEDDGFLRRWAI